MNNNIIGVNFGGGKVIDLSAKMRQDDEIKQQQFVIKIQLANSIFVNRLQEENLTKEQVKELVQSTFDAVDAFNEEVENQQKKTFD